MRGKHNGENTSSTLLEVTMLRATQRKNKIISDLLLPVLKTVTIRGPRSSKRPERPFTDVAAWLSVASG